MVKRSEPLRGSINKRDAWVWRGNESGMFSTASCRTWMSMGRIQTSSKSISWLKWVPPNVLCFIWKLDLGRIPVARNLIVRGVQDIPISCSLCAREPEDIDHLFIRCPTAEEIWRRVSWWANINLYQAKSVGDLMLIQQNNRLTKMQLKSTTLIIYTTIWLLWKNRNSWIFEKRRFSVINMLEKIKTQAFVWVKNRGAKVIVDWEKWSSCPLNAITSL
ncbi:hypothetical protein QVD17_20081 [Tagetes erecta]|uniref:Reverse transcriptase zinc-binding domain-containing protein n=1 Tax=Tagetes erecta TaxID=13708 RepID=A0AAD8NX08_TARER|nr:hypothetical protein QVD17_20081 [Tagetes erecta]